MKWNDNISGAILNFASVKECPCFLAHSGIEFIIFI